MNWTLRSWSFLALGFGSVFQNQKGQWKRSAKGDDKGWGRRRRRHSEGRFLAVGLSKVKKRAKDKKGRIAFFFIFFFFYFPLKELLEEGRFPPIQGFTICLGAINPPLSVSNFPWIFKWGRTLPFQKMMVWRPMKATYLWVSSRGICHDGNLRQNFSRFYWWERGNLIFLF